MSPLGVRCFRTTLERITLYLLAGRGEGRPLHEQKEAADRRRVQVRRCTEFWPLPAGTPTQPEISVLFVFSVPFVFFVYASQYYFVEYQYEHGRGPSAERPHAAPSHSASVFDPF